MIELRPSTCFSRVHEGASTKFIRILLVVRLFTRSGGYCVSDPYVWWGEASFGGEERSAVATRAGLRMDFVRVRPLSTWRCYWLPVTGNMEPAPCATCGQPTSKKCAGCGQVSYCSHACQKRGWKRHKKVCRPPADMATSEVCKVLVDVMRSPEVSNEPVGNVFIDPRQVKVALLCGVPRHRLGPLFVQRNHQWIKEAGGASFRAALAASGDAVRPCSEAYFRSVMESEGSEELVRLIEAGPAAMARAGGVAESATRSGPPGRPCTPARAREIMSKNSAELAAMTGQGESAIRDVLSAAFERDGRADAEGLSEAEAFGRFAQDIARGLGAEGLAPPAFLEAYKAAEGMSTTERPLPQSEPHMQALIDAGILNSRPQEGGRPK